MSKEFGVATLNGRASSGVARLGKARRGPAWFL